MNSKQWLFAMVVAVGFIFLISCTRRVTYAPVVDGWQESTTKQGFHRVTAGETLYSIAWQYGLDYRVLAKNNHLNPPYVLKLGELVTLVSNKSPSFIKKMKKKSNKVGKSGKSNLLLKSNVISHDTDPLSWAWPTTGIIVQDYDVKGMGNKGLDISNKEGTLVRASASGTVVYSGDGIPGYGNLMIIKHNGLYLSAYGHNKRLIIHEGQRVKKGEVIGIMGRNTQGKPMLHFEIRRAGKPVNPHYYLPKNFVKS